MPNKNKFGEIPLLNFILCLGVVIIHLTSMPVGGLEKDSIWYLLVFIVNKFFVFCVPSFLFLSGFKLHNKYRDGVDIIDFYKNRWRKIFVPYIVALTIYFLYFFFKGWVPIWSFPKHLVLGTISAHFYYIVISFQLYLAFPLILKATEKNDKLILGLALASTIIFQQFCHFPYSDRFGGSYIFYFVMGMYFSKNGLYKKLRVSKVAFAFLVAAAVHISLAYLSSRSMIVYRYGEIVNIIYVTSSIMALFGLCSALERFGYIRKIAGIVSANSYNIYLYHCLGISIIRYELLAELNLSMKYEFLLMSAIIFGGIGVYCFLKNRFARK